MGKEESTGNPILESFRQEKAKYKVEGRVISNQPQSEIQDTSPAEEASDANDVTPQGNSDSLEKGTDSTLLDDTPKPTVDHDYEKRFNDSQRYINELKAKSTETEEQYKARIAELEAKAALANVRSEDELLKFKEQYPEVYENVFSIAKRTGLETEQKIAAKLEEVDKKMRELARQEGRYEIQKAHPDYKEVVRSSKFTEWKAIQPDGIINLLESDDPDSVIAGLNIYKDSVGIKKQTAKEQKKAQQIEETLDVSTTSVPAKQNFQGKKIWNESEAVAALRAVIDDDVAYNKLDKEIMNARLEGRFNPGV